MHSALYDIFKIKPEEIKGALLGFLFIFMLMASYMILKPVRDSLASDFTDTTLSWLWTCTFIASTVLVAFYNVLASNINLKKLVPGVFSFFALSFLLMYILYNSGFDRTLLGKTFYVWVSVFALFHISVFWSFVSQHYTKEQGKRVFAFINTGASVGAIAGPLAVIYLVKHLPLDLIMIITSVTLLLTIPLIFTLNAYYSNKPTVQQSTVSSNPFAGMSEFFNSPKLIGIATFIFIFAGISSFFYIAQKDILADYARPERKEILGKLDLYINGLTILLGIFAAGRLSKQFGLATSLSLMPFFMVGSLLLFAAHPTVGMFLVLQVLRKAGNYSITKPAREVLFTGVNQEVRIKTKPFIDVAVYRGADVFWIWFIAFLGQDGVLKLSTSERLCVGAGIALLWGIVGIYIGMRHEKENLTDDYTSSPPDSVPPQPTPRA